MRCKICGSGLHEEPIISYKDMPSCAQNLPTKGSLDIGIDIDVFECTGCGLIQLASDPVPYYKEVIRAAGFSSEMTEFRKKQFEDFVKANGLEDKSVLEVGCGAGEYLSIMDETEANAFGIEEGDANNLKCKEQGLNVIKGFVENEDQEIEGGPFSAFYMMSYLEHLPDPISTLRGIRNNLADDAVGIIEVPNFDMKVEKNPFSDFM